MSLVVLAVVIVWGVLFGAAYLSRMIAKLSKPSSIFVVISSYLALCAIVLFWVGPDWRGLVSIAGMLVPCAVSVGVVLFPFRART